ncbi:MAG: hypothetical protein KC912_18505 [Proteobacteria bacterium]|nr:hypothetical protein [Pseudomonadota bacterium]
MADIEALEKALGDAYRLIDYDEFWQVVRANGEHVGLISPELLVQLDLSVIFFPENEDHVYDLAEAADAFLRAEWTEPFAEVGFGISEEGAIQAADSEDKTSVVYSYELPCVTQAEGAEMVVQVLEWSEQQTREFILFDVAGPLVVAEPVEETDA